MTNLNNAQTTSAKFNPFHGVDFPITSVNLVTIINGLREQYNEKVVKLRHYDFLTKIESFGFEMTDPNIRVSESKVSAQSVLVAESIQMTEQNFLVSESKVSALNVQVAESTKVSGQNSLLAESTKVSPRNISLAESTYLDAQGKERKCYLIPKTECRALASTESNTICYKLMQYLDQLEAESKTLKKYFRDIDCRKDEKFGITPWRCIQVAIIPSLFPYLMKQNDDDHYTRIILNALLDVLTMRGSLKAIPSKKYQYIPLAPALVIPSDVSGNGFNFTIYGRDKLLNNEPVWSAVHALIKDDLIYGRNADF